VTHHPVEGFAEPFECSGLALPDTLRRLTEPHRNLARGQSLVVTELEQLAITLRQL